VLDEEDAKRLTEEVAERVVLEALERGDPEVTALCEQVEFGGVDDIRGLLGSLISVYTRLREDGVEPTGVPVGDAARLRVEFEESLAQLKGLARDAVALEAEERRGLSAPAQELKRLVESATWDSYPEKLGEVRSVLRRQPQLLKTRKEFGACVKALKDGLEGAAGLHTAAVAAPFERTFLRLLGEVAGEHRRAMEEEQAVDFAELILRARNLLRDKAGARAAAQARFEALLVDEFQDTNDIQWELVCLLSDREAPQKSAVGPQLGMELERRGMLCVVGDRKQSIYEFRGANVSIFERAAKKIEQGGGARAHLQQNRRSQAPLLDFFNGVFGELMRPSEDAQDYEVGYQAGADDLEPVRCGPGGGFSVERLTFDPTGRKAHECRALEAEALAARLATLLSENGAPVVVDGGAARRARPGEVGVVFARLTQVEVYRQALLKHGVPHRVVRGRGFYGAQEVLDVASLLTLAADDTDAVALAAVLRSPWVGLTDGSLLRLMHNHGRFSFEAVQAWREGELLLPPKDRERLANFLTWFEPLRRASAAWPVDRLLKEALDAADLRPALAASAQGAQALANVEKLVGMAERWARGARGDARQFAQHVLSLADSDPLEAVAELTDAAESGLVQLLTIHQAKGLEWPVLVAADLGAAPATFPTGAFAFDRRLGLAMNPEFGTSSRVAGVTAELRRREAAESTRRLYVALTRARDLLILSGQPSQKRKTWRERLDALIDSPRLRPLVKDIPFLPSAQEETAPQEVEPSREERAAAKAVLDRVRAPRPQRPQLMSVALLEEAHRCPRRAWLMLHSRSEDLGDGPDVPLDPNAAKEQALSPFHPLGARACVRGALARLDYGLHSAEPTVQAAHVEALLASVGLPPGTAPFKHWAARVGRLLQSPFAKRVAKVPPAQVQRAAPYRVELSEGLAVVGNADLILDEAKGMLAVHFALAPPVAAGAAPYQVQLQANSLSRRAGEGRGEGGLIPVQSALLVLDSESQDLVFAAKDDSFWASVQEPLNTLGRHIPAPQPQDKCKALGCALLDRCHGAGPAL
jgi:ATP-dependent exoDNAse (exonuclease V) beta subunit